MFYRYTYTSVFMVALFLMAKTRTKDKYRNCTFIKWSFMQPQPQGNPVIYTTRINPKDIIQSGINQLQKEKYCMIPTHRRRERGMQRRGEELSSVYSFI